MSLTKILIENGAEICVWDDVKKLPIHYANENFYPEMVNFLVKRGANIYAKDHTGQMISSTQAQRDIHDRLWQRTPLLKALHMADVESFTEILNDDAYDVNEDVSSNGDEWTILHIAAYRNRNCNCMDFVRLLLDCDRIEKFRVTKSRALTALHVAIARNDADFASVFLHHYSTRHGHCLRE